jgi:glyoxylase-like metal-dependent hydrolase (beta-lactamase superfamily II)
MAMMYGIPFQDPIPVVNKFIKEGDIIKFGNSKLEAIFTPGHSPASLSFYCKEAGFLIAGDVLFYGSIGRTDLPGGDFNTLISSIKDKLFLLGDNIEVHPGHGPKTTIGFEKRTNPFLV